VDKARQRDDSDISAVEPLQTNAASILGLDARTLLLARWDPTVPPSGGYHIWPVVEPFQPGRAYWVKLPSNLTISVQGALPAINADYPVPVSLGWNQVGSPRQTAVDVADLKVQVGNGTPCPSPTRSTRGSCRRVSTLISLGRVRACDHADTV